MQYEWMGFKAAYDREDSELLTLIFIRLIFISLIIF